MKPLFKSPDGHLTFHGHAFGHDVYTFQEGGEDTLVARWGDNPAQYATASAAWFRGFYGRNRGIKVGEHTLPAHGFLFSAAPAYHLAWLVLLWGREMKGEWE